MAAVRGWCLPVAPASRRDAAGWRRPRHRSTAAAVDSRTVPDVNTHRHDPELSAELGWVALSSRRLEVRLRPAVPSHVRQLAEVLDRCPPVIAHRGTRRLLDGFMRVDAAL